MALGYWVDKALVKTAVGLILGPERVTPNHLVTDDYTVLSTWRCDTPYVVKPTHLSKAIILKPDAGALTPDELKQCQHWLNSHLFAKTREYQYKALKPKILVEPLLTYQLGAAPELKCYVINGQVQFLKLILDRYHNKRLHLYTPDWQRLAVDDGVSGLYKDTPDWPCPAELPCVLDMAQRLGQLFPVVRIDCYLTNDGVRFGEITLTPANASQCYQPADFLQNGVSPAVAQQLTAFI
jgi:hypothetical protein